jgi:hypothetical protein
VADVADDLGADWHTVNDAVVAYGGRLVDDPECIGAVTALGLDEGWARGSTPRSPPWSYTSGNAVWVLATRTQRPGSRRSRASALQR